MTDDEWDALRERCTRFVHGHGPVRVPDLLATIPADTAPDWYGKGGIVGELEAEIAALLEKPAAVFFPSGTMAQQLTLRVLASRHSSDVVMMHPLAHPLIGEEAAISRLQHLVPRAVGDTNRLLTLDDLNGVAEPAAALLLELPQREIGGQQPSWDDLQAQVRWARDRGLATHLDGARIWESAVGYRRPLADIAQLFDTVYVSFYKILGALPGACIAGPAEIVAEVREWRKRMGGTIFGLWPNAASARTCLRTRAPLVQRYFDHGQSLADALRDVDGVRVVPDPPHTPMFHILLTTSPETLAANAYTLAANDGIWTWRKGAATGDPGVQRVELAVGDRACEWEPAAFRDIVARLVKPV
ncbi:MAG: threonine aldolase family protein [Acidothermaceae bacterium]